jgi:hypothetical protein
MYAMCLFFVAKTVKGKALMKQQEEEKDRAQVQAIMHWVEKHRVKVCNLMNSVGKCVMPTAWLDQPGDLAARELKAKNTAIVDKSISQLGKIDAMTNVECVSYTDELKAAGLNPKNLVFDELKPKPAGVKFRAIIGANTITSIGKSHQTRPGNPDFAHIHATLIVCENTAGNRSMAKAYGGLENRIRDNRSGSDTWDCLWTSHLSYTTLLAAYGNSDKSALKKAWQAEKKLLWASSNIGSVGAFDQNMTIAQRTGPVWDFIARIFKGEVDILKTTGKPPKAPTGVGHFKNMGGIPDKKLEEWLAMVCNGEETTKEFSFRCIRHKQRKNVQEVIVEYISAVRSRTDLTWDDACEQWPSIGDEKWFEMLMSWCGSVTTATLTSAVKDEICARLLHDEEEDEVDDDNVTQVNIFCVFFSVLTLDVPCWVVLIYTC